MYAGGDNVTSTGAGASDGVVVSSKCHEHSTESGEEIGVAVPHGHGAGDIGADVVALDYVSRRAVILDADSTSGVA